MPIEPFSVISNSLLHLPRCNAIGDRFLFRSVQAWLESMELILLLTSIVDAMAHGHLPKLFHGANYVPWSLVTVVACRLTSIASLGGGIKESLKCVMTLARFNLACRCVGVIGAVLLSAVILPTCSYRTTV